MRLRSWMSWGCLITLGVSGCGGGPTTGGLTPAAQASRATSAAPTTTQAQRSTEVELPDGFVGTRFISNCDGQPDTDVLSGRQMFDTASGEFVDMPSPTLANQEELVSAACTVTQTPGGETRVVYAMTVKTPSQGLTPESVRADVISLDPKTIATLSSKPLSAPLEPTQWVLNPAAGGFSILVTDSDGASLDRLAYFNVDTLDITSELDDTRLDDSWISGAIFNGYAVSSSSGIGFFTPDGGKIGEFPNPKEVTYTDNGFLIEPDSGKSGDPAPGLFYFDMATRETIGPIAPYLPSYNVSNFISALSGVRHFFNLYNDTTYGDLVLLKGNRFMTGTEKYLKVYDTAAKKELFSLSGEQLESLEVDLDNTSIGGDYLYVTKEPDNPVIDYRTGEDVATGWNLMATEKFADGWVLISRSSSEKSAGSGYLARGGQGDYDGPWF